MESEMTPKEQLDSLKNYQAHLCEKYEIGYPSYLKKIKTPKHALKEVEKLTKAIDKLAKCERHGGFSGLECNMCDIEGTFNKLLC